jgi:hypothetical protein
MDDFNIEVLDHGPECTSHLLQNALRGPEWCRPLRGRADHSEVDDYELIAQNLSGLAEDVRVLSERVSHLGNRMADVLSRVTDAEKLSAHLEEAALTTARALEEVSGHWDAVYEAMRRKGTPIE